VARLRGCFVTGTDTGVGKTVVAAGIVAVLQSEGIPVQAFKPVITGLDQPAQPGWPHDHELLARVARCPAEQVVLAGYGPPVSPHLAAELAGARAPSVASLSDGVRNGAVPGSVLVVEGVGGLLVPLDAEADTGADVRALARELGLALVVAARPGLGTINHTLLTLEAARLGGLRVAGVVLTPWPERPGTIERSNLVTIARRGAVEVATLGFVANAEPGTLAAAAAGLPLERWLGLEYGRRCAFSDRARG
jgi:dethiobiotin synthetase